MKHLKHVYMWVGALFLGEVSVTEKYDQEDHVESSLVATRWTKVKSTDPSFVHWNRRWSKTVFAEQL